MDMFDTVIFGHPIPCLRRLSYPSGDDRLAGERGAGLKLDDVEIGALRDRPDQGRTRVCSSDAWPSPRSYGRP